MPPVPPPDVAAPLMTTGAQRPSGPLPVARPIRFFYQGRIQEVSGADPHRTVLEWLREDVRSTGTKEGCNEGDCGACTVILVELASAHGGGPQEGAPIVPAGQQGSTDVEPTSRRHARVGALQLRTINACLRLLPTLDGKALLTIEDLSPCGGPLHPVQQALVDTHASQCGFCTPGFAMSLTACYETSLEHQRRPQRAELVDTLAGNLCRCTGYRPLLQAGQRMFEAPPQRLALGRIEAALRSLQTDPPLHYRPAGSPHTFLAPRSTEGLVQALVHAPGAQLIAGTTDLGLAVNKRFQRFETLVSTSEVDELRHITRTPSDGIPTLTLGAAVPLEDAWCALTEALPPLAEIWRRFASPPIRHAGTLGGNVVNGSPIGDGPPVLLALDARLRLQQGPHTRTVPLDRFYSGYQRNDLQPGEFLHSIEVPLWSEDPPGQVHVLRAWKHARRHDSDISTVLAAFHLILEHSSCGPPQVQQVRLAFGGMAATPARAAQAESALRAGPWNESRVLAAMKALDQDFTPWSDLRASATHRRRIAAQLLWRLWLETRPDRPVPPEQLDVHHPALSSHGDPKP